MIFCVVLGVDLVYHFAPNRKARWSWLTPGSLVATALWILSSFAFKFYYLNRSRTDELGGFWGGLKPAIVRSRARAAMHKYLALLKTRLARDFAKQALARSSS